MNGPEKNFWNNIRPKLRSFGDFTRHEDGVQVGQPDVSYGSYYGGKPVNGWIELKALRVWPKLKQTPIRIEHYTPEQRLWLRKRGRAGGRCFLLIRIEGDTMLFHWSIAQKVGGMTRAEMIRGCTRYWMRRKFKADELIWELTK